MRWIVIHADMLVPDAAMVKGAGRYASNAYDFVAVIGYHTPGMKERSGLAFRFPILALVLAGVSGCGPTYSPDTYASNAAQQANKVEQGVVVGVRAVAVSAAGTVGTVTGAAAGGIAGSQATDGALSAFTALGGSLVGGIAGSTVEHVTADTQAYEYIVRKPNGDLVSVTQKDRTPLALGQKVLVIAGTQARVVPDYTVPPLVSSSKVVDTAKTTPPPSEPKPSDPKPDDAKRGDVPPTDAAPPAAQTPPAPASAAARDPADAPPAGAAPAAIPQADVKPAEAAPGARSGAQDKPGGGSP
jgi:outer membrane lipoprotein SlyB